MNLGESQTNLGCFGNKKSQITKFYEKNNKIQSGPLIVNPQGTMLSCSYYKDFILSRLASVLLL